MSKGGKNDASSTGDDSPVMDSVTDAETFGAALSEVGFVPANVAPKTVSQGKGGKGRETLKRRALKKPDE